MITIFKELYNNIKTELKLCFYKLKLMGASLPDKYKSLNIIGKVKETLDKYVLSPTGISFAGFLGDSLLDSVDIISISPPIGLVRAFLNCLYISLLDLSHWAGATNLRETFNNCRLLKYINLSTWDMSKCNSLDIAFKGCFSLVRLDVKDWDTSNVTSFLLMCYGCSSLSYIDVSKWNVSKAKDFRFMFQNCLPLKILDFSNWNMESAILVTMICAYDSNIKSIIGDYTLEDNKTCMNNLKVSTDFAQSQLLRYSSMLALVKGVADLSSSESSSPTITFNSTCWKNMRNDDDTIPSSDIIAERQLTLTLIAADKNWNLAH